MDYGILAVLPPVVAILLAFIAKNAIVALFAAVIIGYMILYGLEPMVVLDQILNGIIAAFSDRWAVIVIISIALAFGMSRLIEKSGGGRGLVEFLTEKHRIIKGKKGSCFLTWLIGLILYTNTTLSVILTGVVMKPLNDRLKVSHEKQAFIIKVTGPPVCGLIPLGQWGGILFGLITAAEIANPSKVMLQVSALNFYCILAVFSSLVLILLGKDFGGLKKAEARAEKFGLLDNPNHGNTILEELPEEIIELAEQAEEEVEKSTSAAFVFVPAIASIVIAIGYMFYSGGGNMLNGDAIGGIFCAMVLSSLICIIMNMASKKFKFNEVIDIFINGMGESMQILIILIAAVVLGDVISDLGTGTYLANLFSGIMSPSLLPAILFFITSLIGFATGSAMGNVSTMMPIAIPWSIAAGANLPLCIAAVWGAAFFGDHISPISDTTYMTCGIVGCDVHDHIKTVMPYGLIWCGISLVCYVIAGFIL